MAETDLNLDGSRRIGHIRIDPLQITADGGADYPCLRLVAHIDLESIGYERAVMTNEPSPTLQDHTLIQLSGDVFYAPRNGGMAQIGTFSTGPILRYSRDGLSTVILVIPLDPYRVKRLEDQRLGDMKFQINFTALFAQHPRTSRNERNTSIETMKTAWFQLQGINIPQSHWLTLLPKLGYGTIHLVEVPIPERILPDTFTKALIELDEAERYMRLNDCDKVVGHCRSALETLTSVVPLKFGAGTRPSFPDKIDKLVEYLAETLADSKGRGLAQMCKALWTLGSIPEHPHVPGYYNRADAEMLMLTTTAILAYVGKLLSSRETNVNS